MTRCTDDIEFSASILPFIQEPEHRSTWQGGKGHRAGNMKRPDRSINREFISFDGEGIAQEPTKPADAWAFPEKQEQIAAQPYVLLANSKGQRIVGPEDEGLSTVDCLEFLLNTKQQFPNSIFVGFGFNYDINQILKDLSVRKLEMLHERNQVTFRARYWIEWMPRKWLIVKHRSTKRSMILYDTIGFFQASFLSVCISYLGKDDPRLKVIEEGKSSRAAFSYSELEPTIIPYNDMELEMHVQIMNILREDLKHVDAVPDRWHGPGAVASKVFAKRNIPITRETPEEVLDVSQFAFAGGRFEQFKMGRHPNTVYGYDINSAYPKAATELPDLSQGYWEHVTTFEPLSFGVWYIQFDNYREQWYEDNRPQPLFCRSKDGNITYPNEVEGWYWTPEAALVPYSVVEGYVFRESTDIRPFAFVERLYEQRRILKAEKNPSERAIKLILNSIYGKLAQTIGGENGPPAWHQLEWAGYITSYTRAKMYEAMAQKPYSIIAAETDGIFSTEPLDLPLSDRLGDWKETIYDEICYIQSGIYFLVKDGKVECKTRGLDRDENGQPKGMGYEKVKRLLSRDVKHLKGTIHRFVGLGLSLQTNFVWRSWPTTVQTISLYTLNAKRNHPMRGLCTPCARGVPMNECLHPLEIGGHYGKSHARAIPWRTVAGPEAMVLDWTEDEMDPAIYLKIDDEDRWQ